MDNVVSYHNKINKSVLNNLEYLNISSLKTQILDPKFYTNKYYNIKVKNNIELENIKTNYNNCNNSFNFNIELIYDLKTQENESKEINNINNNNNKEAKNKNDHTLKIELNNLSEKFVEKLKSFKRENIIILFLTLDINEFITNNLIKLKSNIFTKIYIDFKSSIKIDLLNSFYNDYKITKNLNLIEFNKVMFECYSEVETYLHHFIISENKLNINLNNLLISNNLSNMYNLSNIKSVVCSKEELKTNSIVISNYIGIVTKYIYKINNFYIIKIDNFYNINSIHIYVSSKEISNYSFNLMPNSIVIINHMNKKIDYNGNIIYYLIKYKSKIKLLGFLKSNVNNNQIINKLNNNFYSKYNKEYLSNKQLLFINKKYDNFNLDNNFYLLKYYELFVLDRSLHKFSLILISLISINILDELNCEFQYINNTKILNLVFKAQDDTMYCILEFNIIINTNQQKHSLKSNYKNNLCTQKNYILNDPYLMSTQVHELYNTISLHNETYINLDMFVDKLQFNNNIKKEFIELINYYCSLDMFNKEELFNKVNAIFNSNYNTLLLNKIDIIGKAKLSYNYVKIDLNKLQKQDVQNTTLNNIFNKAIYNIKSNKIVNINGRLNVNNITNTSVKRLNKNTLPEIVLQAINFVSV